MRIRRLEIRDFLGFESVDLDFDHDVYFIVGENRDQTSQRSNGSGKSALTQAITWCLFESLRPGCLKDDVIRWGAEHARVRLVLEHGGDTIAIERFRKHPKLGNHVGIEINGYVMDQHKKADTDAAIEKALGISEAMFMHAAFSEDSDARPQFASLSPALMMKAVSEIINIERFDAYNKSLVAIGNDYKLRVGKAQNAFEHSARAVSTAEDLVDSIRVQIDSFEAARKIKLELKEEKLVSVLADIDRIRGEREDLSEDYHQFMTYDRGFARDRERAEILLGQLEYCLDRAKLRRREITARRDAARAKVVSLRDAHKNITQNRTDECKYCGGSLSNSEKLLDKQMKFEEDLEAASARYTELEARLVKKIFVVDRFRKQKEEVERKLKSFDEAEAEFTDLKFLADQYLLMGERHQQADRMVLDLRKDIDDLKMQGKGGLQELLAQNLETLKEARRRLEKTESDLQDVLQGAEAVKTLQAILGDMKIGILNAFVIDLLDQINGNLYEISDGDFEADLSLRKESLVLRFNNSTRFLPYISFSRGERVRISKATQVALCQLCGVKILIDDEGLSGADNVSDIMDFVLGSGIDQFFFTSHSGKVADFLEQYPVIRVTKQDGISTARIEVAG